jgi:hypothetical protein
MPTSGAQDSSENRVETKITNDKKLVDAISSAAQALGKGAQPSKSQERVDKIGALFCMLIHISGKI